MIFIATNKALVDCLTEDELRDLVKSSKSLHQLLKRIGYSSQSGANRNTVMRRIEEYKITINHFSSISNGVKHSYDDIFCENSEVTQATLRRYYIKYNMSPYVCAICGQPPVWNSKPLTLTLDHVDGNNTNNLPSNLRWVCPNCDRQLPTFCSKNRKYNKIDK